MSLYRYQFPATGTLHGDIDERIEALISCIDARGVNNGDYDKVLTLFPDRKNRPVVERIDICADEDNNIKALDIYTDAELAHGMEEAFRSHVEEQVEKINDSLELGVHFARNIYISNDTNITITGPVTKENIVGDVKNVCGSFDFDNAEFSFGEASRPDDHSLNNSASFSLMDAFDDADISPYIGSFSDDVLESAKNLAEQARDEENAFEGDITVEKGEGRSIDILVNGKKELNVNLEIYIECNEGSKLLPDGNAAIAMWEYDWQQFDALEAAVQAKDAQDNQSFADAVASIYKNENGLEQ